MSKLYLITGTYHGGHVYGESEGEARRYFHLQWKGESILHVSCEGKVLQDYVEPYLNFSKFMHF